MTPLVASRHQHGLAIAVAILLGWSAAANAKESKDSHRLTSDLDGSYITLGPVAGALQVQDTWNSAVGAELSLVRLREGRWPALLGVAVGAVSYGDLPGGRAWAELELGVDRLRLGPLPLKLGLAAGLAIEVDRTRPPRFGAQATLFVFAGALPYVRVGTLEQTGAFVEAGLMIKIPVKIWD